MQTPSQKVVARRSSWFSERALDATTFFLADVADGLGPFLVIDLTSRRHWSASSAGAAMAALLLGTVVTQSFVGAWIDRTKKKTLAMSIAALTVALASIGLFYTEQAWEVFVLQGVTGIAVTVFPPAIGAVSLGIVGRQRLAARAGRNEASFHAGNVASAGLAVLANRLFGTAGIFYGVGIMAVLSAISACAIRTSDIDHNLARGADTPDDGPVIEPWTSLFRDNRLTWFAVSVVLFHFANAAMLPLVGQKAGQRDQAAAQTLMAQSIIVAQLAMVPVAILASQFAVHSRWKVFLVGFAVLPVRGWLYTMTDEPFWLIAIQILDGIGAGIFGVVGLLMMADLTRGTGRFCLAQGVMATAIGLGAAASNFLTGRVVDQFGYNAGFLFLAAIAVLALATFAWRVPETAQQHSGGVALTPLSAGEPQLSA